MLKKIKDFFKKIYYEHIVIDELEDYKSGKEKLREEFPNVSITAESLCDHCETKKENAENCDTCFVNTKEACGSTDVKMPEVKADGERQA